MPSKGINILRTVVKVVAYFLLIIAIIAIIMSLSSWLSWNTKKSNYTKQCAFSDGMSLYYNSEGRNVYADEIYDTSGKQIKLNIPLGQSIIVYADKSNENRCIYFDVDDTFDMVMLNPSRMLINFYLLLVAFLGFVFAEALKKEYVFKMPSKLRLCSFGIFIVGVIVIIVSVVINISNIATVIQGNSVESIVYSKVYSNEKGKYMPVARYVVEESSYAYISKDYKKGALKENIGSKIKLYYNKRNPNKVVEKGKIFDVLNLVLGLLTAFIGLHFTIIEDIGVHKKELEEDNQELNNKKEQ